MVQPPVPAPTSRRRRWRRVGLGVAVAMVPALFAWLGWQSINSRKPPPAAPVTEAVAPLPAASEGWAQVQAQFCLRCHGMQQTHVGPGFAQIAQRYRDQPEALAYLARKIREGSAGVWGRKLMPRQPGISTEQAQAMAVWLLAQPDPEQR